jgi:hypothetical protein
MKQEAARIKREIAGETLRRWLLNEFERIQKEAGGRHA